MPISRKTATEVAFAYREIETAEKLLADIATEYRPAVPDIRDAFGHHVGGLQLGVPRGDTGQRLFNVPWSLARPIIEAHIAQQRAIIAALSEKARIELTEGAIE